MLEHTRLAVCLLLGLALSACESQPPPSPAEPPSSPPSQNKSPDAGAEDAGDTPAAAADTAPPDTAPAGPEPLNVVPETQPPGEPGPFQITLPEGDVSEFGVVTETEDAILLAYRMETYEEELCDTPGLDRCSRWYIVVRDRNEARKSDPALLVESDSPSGIQVEAAFPLGEAFAVLWREGRYTEDPRRILLSRFDRQGAPLDVITLHPEGMHTLRNTHGAPTPEGAVACWQNHAPPATTELERMRRRHIACRALKPEGALGDIHIVSEKVSAPNRQPVVAFLGGSGLVAWTRRETLYVRAINAQGQPTGPETPIGEPGKTTPRRPLLVPGHGGFLLIWQNTDGILLARRLEANGRAPEGTPLDLAAIDGAFATAQGGVAVPQGFVVTLPVGKNTRVALLDAKVTRAESVELQEKGKFFTGGRGIVRVRDRRKNRFYWQLAATLPEIAPEPTAPESADTSP